ncbi:hypothetical protein [Aeromicrobium alkaliterrae]|uniref:PASTA domain-containing protein n=1 Tax=Aeromicrobium alkaliterrae TaxID=302168 RepID=A0ABN2K136_9ACTN
MSRKVPYRLAAAAALLSLVACSSPPPEPEPALPDPYGGSFPITMVFSDNGSEADVQRIRDITTALEDGATDACPLGDSETFQPPGSPDLVPAAAVTTTASDTGTLGDVPTATCTAGLTEVDVHLVEEGTTALVAAAILEPTSGILFSEPVPLLGGEAFGYCAPTEDQQVLMACGAVWVHDEIAISVRPSGSPSDAQRVAEWFSDALGQWVGGDDGPAPTPFGQLPADLTASGVQLTTGGRYVDFEGSPADATITVHEPVGLTEADLAAVGRLCSGGLYDLTQALRFSDLQLEGGIAQAVEMTVTSPDPSRPFPLEERYVFPGMTFTLEHVLPGPSEAAWTQACSFDRTPSSVRIIGVAVLLPPAEATAENPDQLVASCPTALTLTGLLSNPSITVKPDTPYGDSGTGWTFPVPADSLAGRCLA